MSDQWSDLRRRMAERPSEQPAVPAVSRTGASRTPTQETKTDEVETKAKLSELMERAKQNGAGQGPMIPIEALITVWRDEWTWQVVDGLSWCDRLSHRLVFESPDGSRRDVLMTEGLETAMGAASAIVELGLGLVLIEPIKR